MKENDDTLDNGSKPTLQFLHSALRNHKGIESFVSFNSTNWSQIHFYEFYLNRLLKTLKILRPSECQIELLKKV